MNRTPRSTNRRDAKQDCTKLAALRARSNPYSFLVASRLFGEVDDLRHGHLHAIRQLVGSHAGRERFVFGIALFFVGVELPAQVRCRSTWRRRRTLAPAVQIVERVLRIDAQWHGVVVLALSKGRPADSNTAACRSK